MAGCSCDWVGTCFCFNFCPFSCSLQGPPGASGEPGPTGPPGRRVSSAYWICFYMYVRLFVVNSSCHHLSNVVFQPQGHIGAAGKEGKQGTKGAKVRTMTDTELRGCVRCLPTKPF